MASLMDWLTKIIPTAGTVLIALFSYWTSKQINDREQQQDERSALREDLKDQRDRNAYLERQHIEDQKKIDALNKQVSEYSIRLIELENKLGVRHTFTDVNSFGDDEV
ncbi:MAG: hypothetical protein DF199_06550 [Lactobacillus delbrueckii subsp. lactis]|uniref:Holin n=2 Tax=Lactobacillus delbrueckii TaxID=1584 RepID=A0A3G6JDQ4_LACDL|nr:hol-like chemotaxis [Lactobacillus phage JCL1032]ACB72568.1 hypothetical protein [Lactobacillus phage JCL1032]AZA15993.1 MAG: hypothetical protein DQL93_05100 [Lactobacillus delbrueckii subsp. lactis]AZA25441.1 MAG: hypothetical protein DF199_06550 [Lactobacillus delbrueckii subsp. lactis]MCD5576467.1 hypothetical protein [Lactobacillus delbrueckii subsp. lactis]